MAFQQRGRLLVPIKTQVVPIGDLGLPIGGVSGLQFPDDLPPILAVNSIGTPNGPRLLQGDIQGHLIQTLAKPTQVNLIAPRTDTVTSTSADFQTPAFTVAGFLFRVTAISGAGAQVIFSIRAKTTQGDYSSTFGGATLTAVTAVGNVAGFLTPGSATSLALLTTVYQIVATISGTTPSVTWYCDLVYK